MCQKRCGPELGVLLPGRAEATGSTLLILFPCKHAGYMVSDFRAMSQVCQRDIYLYPRLYSGCRLHSPFDSDTSSTPQ